MKKEEKVDDNSAIRPIIILNRFAPVYKEEKMISLPKEVIDRIKDFELTVYINFNVVSIFLSKDKEDIYTSCYFQPYENMLDGLKKIIAEMDVEKDKPTEEKDKEVKEDIV